MKITIEGTEEEIARVMRKLGEMREIVTQPHPWIPHIPFITYPDPTIPMEPSIQFEWRQDTNTNLRAETRTEWTC
jgi:hypothetical protein